MVVVVVLLGWMFVCVCLLVGGFFGRCGGLGCCGGCIWDGDVVGEVIELSDCLCFEFGFLCDFVDGFV